MSGLATLALRAVVIHWSLRVVVAGIGAAVAAAAGPGAPTPDSPFGMVLLVTVLGALDIRRRGESMLWANLGYPVVATAGVFAGVAFAGELSLALVRA